MADFVTFPMPLEPDIEIVRRMGNFSYKVPTNCTRGGGGVGAACGNGSEIAAGAEEQVAWMGASQDVLYYAYPAIIGWGVFTGLLSIIVVARQLRASSDSYLLGFLISSILLLICGGILKVNEYIGHSNTYQYAYVYVKSVNDWLWYVSLWILVVMSLERGMSVAQNRTKTMCTPGQACVVTVMVFCVCLVSALPQFWEYEVTETFDYGTNQTLAMSQLSEAATTPEYRIMYFWYTVSITVFLPYPILIVMLGMLSQGMRHSRKSRRRHSLKHGTGSVLNRKVTEEMHVTRLFIVMILLYFLLTGPLTFLQLIHGVTPQWMWPQDGIYPGLYNIFEFAFYFYFSSTFLLLLSYSDKFRYSLGRTCCCCCMDRDHKRDKRNAKQKRRSDHIDHEIIIPQDAMVYSGHLGPSFRVVQKKARHFMKDLREKLVQEEYRSIKLNDVKINVTSAANCTNLDDHRDDRYVGADRIKSCKFVDGRGLHGGHLATSGSVYVPLSGEDATGVPQHPWAGIKKGEAPNVMPRTQTLNKPEWVWLLATRVLQSEEHCYY